MGGSCGRDAVSEGSVTRSKYSIEIKLLWNVALASVVVQHII